MADVIELVHHARVRRLLQLFLRRHGISFFLERRGGETFQRLDERKVDLILRLADTEGDDSPSGLLQQRIARNLVRRQLIARLAHRMVENGY